MATKIRTLMSSIAALLASLAAFLTAQQASARESPQAGVTQESNFRSFLVDLMSEPAKIEAFREDPEAMLAATNLSPEQKDALRRGDASKIQLLLAETSGGASKKMPIGPTRPILSEQRKKPKSAKEKSTSQK